MSTIDHKDIRIGTLVNGLGADPANYIKQILPNGFESFSITFWQSALGTDLDALAEKVNRTLEGSGAVISSIGIFGNPLENDEMDVNSRKSWEVLIEKAHLFGTDLVAGFSGRVRGKSIPKSIDRLKEVFTPLLEKAGERGVSLAFENCSMGGTWDNGDWNIAHNPLAWELMFDALPYENLGLEWEPCHQLVQLIDPLPQIREWGHRFMHIHGKDASIHWAQIKRHGISTQLDTETATLFGKQPLPNWAHHRTPGFGDTNWTDLISELRLIGFQGSIDIEGWHDPVYRADLEMTGQVHSLNYLKNCRGGPYIKNPV